MRFLHRSEAPKDYGMRRISSGESLPDSRSIRRGPSSVSYRSLNVYGHAAPDDYQKTFGNYPVVILRYLIALLGGRRKSKIRILRDFEGVIRSGEMLVVLGRPGSGCSTLLKTLAGHTDGLFVDEEAELNYHGLPADTVYNELRGECSYQAELDVHFPTLTVGETLDVAAEARAPSNPAPGINRNAYITRTRDDTKSALGLSHTHATKVGSDFLPGISGGERKRLSIAEVLVGFTSLQFWDNSTRGLDSANALRFTRTLRNKTRNTGTAAVISFYQASEDIYNEFDTVVVLYEGRQIFFGAAGTARNYFEALGFLCSDRTPTADFLTSVTNPEERVVKQDFGISAPRTSSEFAKRWMMSAERAELLDAIDVYNYWHPTKYDYPKGHKKNFASWRHHRASPYTIPYIGQIRLCITRGFLRLWNDLSTTISTIIGNCILAIILGSVFYNLPATTDSFYSRGALLFFATLLNAFISGFEPGMLWEQRPIVEKHHRYALYRPSADAIASMICDLPNKILTSLLFNIPLYLMTNLRRTPEAFFTYILFSFTCLLTMSMIFRTIGSVSRTLAWSMAPAAVLMLLLMIYTGFTLPLPYMNPWLRWFNYVNPVAYTFESLMVNEFHGRYFQCSTFVPQGPSYTNIGGRQRICNIVGATPGAMSVNGDSYINTSFEYYSEHLWRNLVITVTIMIIACCAHIAAAEYVSMQKARGEILVFRRGHIPGASGPSDEEKPPATLRERGAGAEKTEKNSHIGNALSSLKGSSGAAFSWNNLSYEIKTKKGSKSLLYDLEGWVMPGTLTALMGPSGSGKTTLLNVLADRASTGVILGEKLVNGQYRSDDFSQGIGYAQQQDIHLPTSTVREALTFSALLRQPKRYSRSERLQYVEEIIGILDMTDFAEAVVGEVGEGLNVEQRKRLTIGVELAARPELLLFLDEPTSGLDSDTAWQICMLLRKLANNGQAILCTIHQPSAILFQMFDRLLLLTEGGKTGYFGDIGANSENMIQYFEQRGAGRCGRTRNPAEWMLDATCGGSEHNHIDWAREWQWSKERQQIKRQISEDGELHPQRPTRTRSVASSGTSNIYQLWIVTCRLFHHYWRTPSYLYSKALLCIGSALFIGISFWMPPNTVQGLQNQVFAVFLLMTTFTNLDQQIIPQFTAMRSLFEIRERPSRIYSWPVFILSNIIVELPWQTLMSVLLFVCWYFPIGMYRNATADSAYERAALAFLGIWSFMLFTSTLSHMVATGIESGQTAVNIAQLLYSLSLIFCGVLATPSSLPAFWTFMYRLSPVTYFVATLLSTTVGNTTASCSPTELLSFDPPLNLSCAAYLDPYIQTSGGKLLNPNATLNCQFCVVTNTNAVLERFGIAFEERWWQWGISLGYSLFNIVAALGIYWVCRVPKVKWRKKGGGGGGDGGR